MYIPVTIQLLAKLQHILGIAEHFLLNSFIQLTYYLSYSSTIFLQNQPPEQTLRRE